MNEVLHQGAVFPQHLPGVYELHNMSLRAVLADPTSLLKQRCCTVCVWMSGCPSYSCLMVSFNSSTVDESFARNLYGEEVTLAGFLTMNSIRSDIEHKRSRDAGEAQCAD